MVSFHEAFNFATLLYTIPAIITYIIFLNILFKKRKTIYCTAFYNYIRLLGVVDLCVYAGFYGVFRAGHFCLLYPFYERFTYMNWFSTIILYLVNVLQHSQHFINLFISVNRFCVIVLSISSQKKLKIFFKITVLWIFLAPAIYLCWILIVGARAIRNPVPKDMPVWMIIDSWKPWDNTPSKGKIFAIVGLICHSITLLLNIITATKTTCVLSKTQQKHTADMKLFFISQLLFLVTVIHCIVFAIIAFANLQNNEVRYYFIVPLECISYDLATLSTPFCFMLLSSSLRKSIIQSITLKKDSWAPVTKTIKTVT